MPRQILKNSLTATAGLKNRRPGNWRITLATGVAFFSNLLNVIAIKLVTNPGYPTAIMNASIVLVLFVSPLVFPQKAGGEFNLRKWLSVAVIVGGIILIILG